MSPQERHRLLRAGQAAFNRGEFFEAHEHWEAVWRAAVEPERTWLQGLIQLAAALHQLSRGRVRPALSLLSKGLPRLADVPLVLDGLLVGRLRDELLALHERLLGGGGADLAAPRLPGD